jgi:hypothetical protein
MNKVLSDLAIELLIEDIEFGFLNRNQIERDKFRSLYDLEEWRPFCENIWKYDDRCRIFVRDSIFLMFECVEDGCVERVSIGNLDIGWETIWSK